jgi:hypothetical protein
MIQSLEQYIHRALLLLAIANSNRKIPASIVIEEESMKKESKITIETCTTDHVYYYTRN